MSTVISAEVPDELNEMVEGEQADDESKSAVVRRLIRAGLDEDDDRQAVWLAAFFAHLAFFAASYTGGNGPAAFVGLAFMFTVLTWATIPTLKPLLNDD